MNRHERRAAASNARAKGLPQQASGSAEAINRGLAAINSGKYQEAEQLFRQMLKADPGMVEAKHQLGTVLARTGRADEGISYLREATAASPKEPLYWSNLAAACYIAHDSKGAIDAARHAVDLQPDYGLAWDNLASSLMDLGEFAEAIPAFQKAISLGAGDIESMKRLSSCYFGVEDYGNAIRVIRDVLQGNPSDFEMLASMGAAQIEIKEIAGAVETLAKAAAIAPDHFPTAYHYGRALRLSGDMTAALRWLRRATSSDPRNPVAWRDLADASLEGGDTENAKVAIDRAMALEPNAQSIRALNERINGPSPATGDFNLDLSGFGNFGGFNLPTTPAVPKVDVSTTEKVVTPDVSNAGGLDLSVLKIGN